MPHILYALIGLVVLAGGGFLIAGNTTAPVVPAAPTAQGAAMEKTGDAMMKEEGMMKGDAMMEKTDSAAMEKKDSAMVKDKGAMMEKHGSYHAYAPEALAMAEHGKVVLFFRAAWCPSCRTVDADIRAHAASIPADVTILDVNYDTASELKKKYGVTYQHTFVQVDAQGNQITTWSASPTLADIVSRLK